MVDKLLGELKGINSILIAFIIPIEHRDVYHSISIAIHIEVRVYIGTYGLIIEVLKTNQLAIRHILQ
jgi:hypothetical protein